MFMYLKLKRHIAKKAVLSKEEYETLTNKEAEWWSKGQLKAGGATVKLVGHENIPKENVLIVSNHQSYFDTWLLYALVDKNKGFIAKTEMQKTPLISGWMRELRCVFMDRDDMKQSLQAILEGIKILKDGYSMVIFPEGTRTLTGEMAEFKAGSFKLATKSKVPVLPITIDGAFRIMKKGKLWIEPSNVTVTIHPPVETKDLDKEEEKLLPEKVFEIVKSALTKEC